MAQEKIRVYVLARELGLDTKDLLDACQKANIDVRNQLSSLDPDQRDVILEILRRGKSGAAAPAAQAKAPAPLSPPTAKIPTLAPARPPVLPPARPAAAAPVAPPAPPPAPVAEAPAAPAPPPTPVPPAVQPAAQAPVAPPTPAPAPAAQTPAVRPTPSPVATPPELPGTPVVPAVAAPVAPISAPEMPPAAKVVAEPTPPPAPPAPVAPPAPAVTPVAPAAEARPPVEPPTAAPAPPRTERPAPSAPVQPVRPAASAPPPQPVQPPRPAAATTPPTTQPVRPPQSINPQRPPPSIAPRPQPPLGGPRPLPGGPPRPGTNPPPGQGGGQGGAGDRKRPAPMGIQRRPTPSSVRGDLGKKPGGPGGSAPAPAPQAPKTEGPKRIGNSPSAAQLANLDKPITLADLLRPPTARPPGTTPPTTPVVATEGEAEDDDRKGKKTLRPGEVPGRASRHKDRNDRAKERQVTRLGGSAKEVANIAIDELVRPSRHGRRPIKGGRGGKVQKIVRTGKVPIELPITVRSLSAAVGIRSGELLLKLMGHGAPPTININSSLDPVLAETLALDLGTELEIKRPVDVEQGIIEAGQKPDAPEDLVLRAPIVTIMGHVDHGKTSLLDRIRQKYGVQSNVVATEAGGITQSLRAWRVEKDGKPVTFLDTPGHEAFTKMRARGANVTDIAVIVVAVDDGVMPQTEEAISHARAAGVAMVVALNKIDLPNANLRKAEQQLYGLNVLPDNMGGDVPFIQTSAATGKGIDELLENLSIMAELKELKANPQRSATGTCLEATVSEGEGVNATVLVRNGTLRRGDVVLCGSAYGRVRQLYDDHGQQIDEAGPSVPTRITGLDVAPNADDPFVVVEDLATARDIAERRAEKQHLAQVQVRGPATLESLSATKVTELKIILKADVRGSVEAIRKELEKLQHDEVRLRVLHTGIGGITENDVTLALTSPSDTIIVGFNVVPDDRALQLADERGVQIREYDVIYKLTDDLKAALEGKLKPREEVVHLGRAVVREIFKISRVGTIAGCYVTQGTIERSAKVRVIRSGVVVYPPVDRTASLESLKRFKDDAREVQQGYECGIKIAGYDDVKVDDVVEAYRIEQVLRTLS